MHLGGKPCHAAHAAAGVDTLARVLASSAPGGCVRVVGVQDGELPGAPRATATRPARGASAPGCVRARGSMAAAGGESASARECEPDGRSKRAAASRREACAGRRAGPSRAAASRGRLPRPGTPPRSPCPTLASGAARARLAAGTLLRAGTVRRLFPAGRGHRSRSRPDQGAWTLVVPLSVTGLLWEVRGRTWRAPPASSSSLILPL